MSGKPEAFSADENRALRAALRRLQEKEALSQTAVGKVLGISQQNAGRLLGAEPGAGMSRTTANALARKLGFRDAEHFLLEAGVLAAMKGTPAGTAWANRDSAVRVSRLIGYDEAAITAVVQRFTTDDYRTRPMKWWVTRIGDEDRDLAADRRAEAAAAAVAPAPAEPARRTKRSAAR